MRRDSSRLAGGTVGTWRGTPRRLLAGAAVAVLSAGLSLGSALPAVAADPTGSASPAPSGSAASGPDTRIGPQKAGVAGCSVGQALNNITGLVQTADGLYAVQAGYQDQLAIYPIDGSTCKSTNIKYYNSPPSPRDPQDLTVGSDGSFWVCDCGDESAGDAANQRSRIAVEKGAKTGAKATIYRFHYPTPGLNADAMLLTATDLPIIFATEGGKTSIYAATALPAPDDESTAAEGALTKVGEWSPLPTNTPNPKGAIGNGVVTGAAKSPDGTHVVIRTYSDAYEYTVGADKDIVAAITTGRASVTPLPNETNGQSITYTADGTKFLTVSQWGKDMNGPAPSMLTYERYIAPPPATDPPTVAATDDGSGGGLLAKLGSFGKLTKIVAGVGVVGLVLAIAGILGIRRARRRREEDDYDDYDDDDDYDERRPRRRGGPRGRDGYGPREPAYTGGAYDDSYGGGAGGYGPGGGYGYDPGYGGQPGYDPAYGGQPGYDPAYGGQPGYDPAYGGQPGYDPAYGGQGGYDQGYGQQGGYGYGYEEDFDPMHDPRRR